MKEKAKVLVALGMNQTGIVLTTDSAWVASDIEQVGSSYTDDLGILDAKDYLLPRGIYLWEGIMREYAYGPQYEPETEYEGTVRPVGPEELPALLAMKWLDPMDDNRESIKEGDYRYYHSPNEGKP